MKSSLFVLPVLIFMLVAAGCSDENPVKVNEDPVNSNYIKIITAESGNLKFEIWSATANTLRYSYNKVGFKVYENNTEKNSGFVKFFPKMYHWINSPMHSSPVKAQFNYDNSLQMFTGYMIFTMVSDSSSTWYGFYNYNNQLSLDSSFFTVTQYNSGQIKLFVDILGGVSYFVSLLKPYSPQQGMNTFQCMLHRTDDDIHFTQVDDAQMFIMPWMETMGHGSANNVHPVHIGGGIYEGAVNFNMPGEWSVYDTVYYQNRKITQTIPPKFTFNP